MKALSEKVGTDRVPASYRVTLKCKYLGNSSRIRVERYESSAHGKDPQRIHVGWAHELNTIENYQRAVLEYVERAGWTGTWVVSMISDGAVGVCIEALNK